LLRFISFSGLGHLLKKMVDDIVERIRTENSVERILNPMLYNNLVPAYAMVKHNLVSISRQQKLFRRLIKAESSKVYGCAYKLAKSIQSLVLSKQLLTIDDIMSLQLGTISQLNASLQNIVMESRVELNRLEDYFDRVNDEMQIFVNNGNNYDETRRSYQRLSLELSNAVDASNYFTKLVEVKRVKRELNEVKHKQDMRNELVRTLSLELRMLDKVEEMLRLSIHTSEKVALKSMLLERHLRNTKRAYELLKLQNKTVGSLTNTINIMTEYAQQMHSDLNSGLDEMVRLAEIPDNFYLNNV